MVFQKQTRAPTSGVNVTVVQMTVLINKEIEAQLNRDGAVVVPFFSDHEIDLLKSFYEEIHSQGKPRNFVGGLETTLFSSNIPYKLEVQKGIKTIIEAACNRFFANYRTLCHIFIVKEKNTTQVLHAHQDFSTVDEVKYTSFNLWIPLRDTDKNSGGLWVIKGSHQLNRPLRGGKVLLPDYSAIDKKLENVITPLTTKKGDAILFFHRTIHGSFSNLVDTDRVVVCCGVLPQEAEVCIHYQKDFDSPLEVHFPDENFAILTDFTRPDVMEHGPTDTPLVMGYTCKPTPVTMEEIEKVLVR